MARQRRFVDSRMVPFRNTPESFRPFCQLLQTCLNNSSYSLTFLCPYPPLLRFCFDSCSGRPGKIHHHMAPNLILLPSASPASLLSLHFLTTKVKFYFQPALNLFYWEKQNLKSLDFWNWFWNMIVGYKLLISLFEMVMLI